MNDKQCDVCKKSFDRNNILGCNIFRYTDKSTEHLCTKYYCADCYKLKFLD